MGIFRGSIRSFGKSAKSVVVGQPMTLSSVEISSSFSLPTCPSLSALENVFLLIL